MAIIRIYAGSDGKSHFEEIEPRLEPRGDRRSNPWHHAPGRYAVFTLSGAVDIATREVGPESRVSVFVPLR